LSTDPFYPFSPASGTTGVQSVWSRDLARVITNLTSASSFRFQSSFLDFSLTKIVIYASEARYPSFLPVSDRKDRAGSPFFLPPSFGLHPGCYQDTTLPFLVRPMYCYLFSPLHLSLSRTASAFLYSRSSRYFGTFFFHFPLRVQDHDDVSNFLPSRRISGAAVHFPQCAACFVLSPFCACEPLFLFNLVVPWEREDDCGARRNCLVLRTVSKGRPFKRLN